MAKRYDAAFIETPLTEGITIVQMAELSKRIGDEAFIPLEVQGDGSAAVGLIGMAAAAKIDYRYFDGAPFSDAVKKAVLDGEAETEAEGLSIIFM